MSYYPITEDGIEAYTITSGGQFNIPSTSGSTSGALKTVTITNNEIYPIIAEVQFQCRIRTELVSGGQRTDFEGYFFPEMTTGGTLLGIDISYAEMHLSGTGGVVSSSQGYPAGEGMQANGIVIPIFEVAAGGTETVRVRWTSTDNTANVETLVANGGFVQCLSGIVKLYQKRGESLSVSIT